MKKEGFLVKLRDKYLTLTNKYFYWSIFIFFVGVLTWINNYGFYSHIERTTIRDVYKFEKTLLSLVNNYSNKNDEELQNIILDFTKKWKDEAYYINGIEIIYLDGSSKYLEETKNWDKTSGSRFKINIKKLINKEVGAIEIWSANNQVMSSVVKSMTFSIQDIYIDIYGEKKAAIDGKAYIKTKEKDRISILHSNDEEKPEEKYIVIEGSNGENKNVYFNLYSNIHIKNGEIVKSGDLLISGSFHSAINRIENIYWYRSRITICFAIFTYLILWLSRKRTYKLEELQEKEDLKIKETFQEDLKNNIEIKNTSIIQNKITKYDAILNPPINTLKFENLFDDLDTIGTKFRKVTEKIIFRVYEEQIGRRPLRMSLSTAVYELHEKGILSDTAKNYISIVRVYGNISSHYSDSTICKEEAIAIASSLLNVIDEIYEKNLLNNSRI